MMQFPVLRSLSTAARVSVRHKTYTPMIKFPKRGASASSVPRASGPRSPEVLLEELKQSFKQGGSASLQAVCNQWFERADTMGNKRLGKEAFRGILEATKLNVSDGECDRLFDRLDSDGGGDLSYEEFTGNLRGAMPEFAASLAFMNQYRGHYPTAMKDVRSLLPRFDAGEGDEWIESLDAVLEHHGPRRTRFLLTELMDEAAAKGVQVSPPVITPLCNSIPTALEPKYPGNMRLEKRLGNLVRWNAAVMVSDGNRRAAGVGGHIGTFASICDIWEVAQNHCFRGKSYGGGYGDQVYMQGHASPGAYARAYLEGRLSLEQVMNFRQEVGGKGLSSYPHPRLMPEFWENPTVSMGLGPMSAVYQARFFRYLHLRGLADTSESRVWCFIGDGEMDEPELAACIAVAGRERLNNLIMIVNCNYQRLDGPVRGNSKVIPEFEGMYRGAGFDCIKLIWGEAFNELVDNDHDGALIEALERTPDGDEQRWAAKQDGGLIRRELFEANGLGDRVAHMSDDELLSAYLTPGGHDINKIYAALKQAENNAEKGGRPTVILAKTLKGHSLATFQGRNTVHQSKTLKLDEMLTFRDVLDIPMTDEQVQNPNGGEFFRRFPEGSEEFEYLIRQRNRLGGFYPERRPSKTSSIMQLPPPETYTSFDKGNPKANNSTTMAFATLLRKLMKSGEFGKRCVLHITDEARTFGLNAFFHEFKIHAPFGQHYTPVDHDILMKYSEAPDGVIMQEGISEGGALCSWIAAATSYASQQCPMMPFFIYYSMFGFQRVGDSIWQAADARARGFLIGATGGRTTLNGEGLQHQDGHSLLIALTNPAVVAWDPFCSYEVAYIIKHGIDRMWGQDKDEIHYITVYNENHSMPPVPETDFKEGLLKGLYRFREAPAGKSSTVRLVGSGSIMQQVLAAEKLLEDYGVGCEIWSATNFGELYRDAIACERLGRLNPLEPVPESWVQQCLGDCDGVTVCATDNQAAYPQLIRPYVGGKYVVLGTDGFGRSDTRDKLRRFFEVDGESIAAAALSALARQGKLEKQVAADAIKTWGLVTSARKDITVA